jgi:putative membrane protein
VTPGPPPEGPVPGGPASERSVSQVPVAEGTLPSGEGPAPADGADWRRLSPRMLVVYPLRELLRALPVLAGIVIAGGTQGRAGVWGLVGAGAAAGYGVLRWYTTSYRVSRDQVQVRHGVLQRRTVGVPLDRVRTVDLAAPAMHRALGLVRVTIGTGRSDRAKDDDLRLDGLSAASAASLRDELLHRRAPRPAAPVPLQDLAHARPGWIAYGPFTLSGVVTVGVVIGFAWRIASEARIDPTRLVRASDGLLAFGHGRLLLVLLPLAALVAVAAASSAGYALAFWDFRLVRHPGGSLQVTRGLIATRSVTIEERRLRGVEVSEPLLLRLVRGARLIAIATGLRVGRGAERGGSLLLPPAPREEALRVAAEVLGTAAPVTVPLTRHGGSARRRRHTRLLAVHLPVLAVLLAAWWLGWLPAWPWLAWLALLPAGVALAEDRYRSLGHALSGRTLVTGWGSLVRRRCALNCEGIIGWNLRRSFFQRRSGLVTLVAATAAGRQEYEIQDAPLGEALRLADQALPGLLAPFLERPETGHTARDAS